MELPELREGEFWRVEERDAQSSYYSRHYAPLTLRLRKRKGVFGGSIGLYYEHCDNTEESIQRAAENLIAERAAAEAKMSLLGDYNTEKVKVRWKN